MSTSKGRYLINARTPSYSNVCKECGALVAWTDSHNKWHDELAEQISKASIPTYVDPPLLGN